MNGSQVYTWEPSNEAIAARYGLRAEDVLRFDTNTSPAPPEWLPDWLRGPFDPSINEYVVGQTPMGRAGQPNEVAQGAVFLASDESSFMTGSELVIDGGYLAQ